MKKRFIVLMGFFVLMIFIFAGCGEKNQQQEQGQIKNEFSQQLNQKENEPDFIKGNFTELLDQGKKMKCEFSFEDQETKMNGVAYTDGQKMYQEFFVDQGDIKIENNIIVKDEEVYTWNSMQPGQGMKMNLNEFENNNSEITEENEGTTTAPNLNQSFEYKCESWQVDNKKFETPTDKNFIDMNAFMKNQPSGNQNNNSGNLNQQACAACQYAPNPNECLKEIGCL